MGVRQPAGMTARWRVEGRRILDDRGRQILLRGANVGGRSKRPPFLPWDVEDGQRILLDEVASWGLNCLRLPFTWQALEPERGVFDEGWLDTYVNLVDAAWQRGLACIVDFHQDVFAAPFSGDGFPLWAVPAELRCLPAQDTEDGHWFLQYLDASGPVARCFDRLWANEDRLLDSMEAMWRHMAARLSGHPGVLGYEVINEPGWGSAPIPEFEAETLPAIVTRMGRAILEQDPGALIFNGQPGTGALSSTTWMQRPELPHEAFVFAPHYYQASVSTGGPLTAPAAVGEGIARLAAAGGSDRLGCPVLFGEFGAGMDSPDAARFLRLAYDALDATLSHGTVWEVSLSAQRWNNEHLGLIDASAAPHPAVDEVIRPYPRAVAGSLSSTRWDPGSGLYACSAADTPVDGVSEIFLPFEPRVRCEGGEASGWTPEDRTVQIRAISSGWRFSATRLR